MRSLLALLALAPAAHAAPCRALLNFETTEPGVGRYVVLDAPATGAPSAFRGLALGEGATVVRLDVVPGGQNKPLYEDRFDTLQTVGSAPVKWYGGSAGFEGAPEPGSPGWDFDLTVMVTGVFGPYISVASEGGGYLGGAHGVDDPNQATLKDGKPVDLAGILDGEALNTARAAIAAEAKLRDGWPEGPDPKELTLAGAALMPSPTGLRLHKTLFCCSWAENHNRWELEVPVKPAAPFAALAPDAQGVIPGPAACALPVQVAKGRVMVGGRDVGAAPGRLLGAAWVDATAPKLAPIPGDPSAALALLKRSRGQMTDQHRQTLLEAARHADFWNAEVLAEAGWTAFKLGQRDRAVHLTRLALEQAADPALGARIRYNLGRIYEEHGEPRRAVGLYAASLAQRPNATVEKRLKAVQDALKK